MSRTMAAKEPMREPEMRSQKESNCWQMANQLALALPLCARYTIAAAADAAAVTSASIAFVRTEVQSSVVNAHSDSVAVCYAERGACLTASKKTKTSLLYFALLLMMCTMDRGIDRTK